MSAEWLFLRSAKIRSGNVGTLSKPLVFLGFEFKVWAWAWISEVVPPGRKGGMHQEVLALYRGPTRHPPRQNVGTKAFGL